MRTLSHTISYSSAIDMWSLGCIVVELFLGLPLFPGSSEYNQVSRITEMLGLPPTWMLEMGKQSGEFFEKTHDEYGRRTYRLKSMEQYSREHGTKEQPSKKYFQATTLPEIIRSYSMPRKNMKQSEIDRGKYNQIQNRKLGADNLHRNEQPFSIHRFCQRPTQHQSAREMVTTTSEASPFHHPSKVYAAVCATHESEDISEQITGARPPAATTSGSS